MFMDLTIAQLMYYLFATVLVVAALAVISVRNPVHAVLFLILAFFNAAGMMLIHGAEFLAMIVVIVYVGAVAVLFLFVVMMLNVDNETLRREAKRNAVVGIPIGLILLAEVVWMAINWQALRPVGVAKDSNAVTNTEALGLVLYTDYAVLFQTAGLILLVAMIGAIVLTLRHRHGVKRQDIGKQNSRRADDVVKLVKKQAGEGV